MQAATGSNVVTATSQRNPVTGAIALTPMTANANGVLRPAREVLPYTDFTGFIADPIAWKLILLVFVQMIFVTMIYGPIAAYLVEAFPAKIPIHRAVPAVSHRRRNLRWLTSADWSLCRGSNRQYLRWSLLPGRRGRDFLCCWSDIPERNPQCDDLEGAGRRSNSGTDV